MRSAILIPAVLVVIAAAIAMGSLQIPPGCSPGPDETCIDLVVETFDTAAAFLVGVTVTLYDGDVGPDPIAQLTSATDPDGRATVRFRVVVPVYQPGTPVSHRYDVIASKAGYTSRGETYYLNSLDAPEFRDGVFLPPTSGTEPPPEDPADPPPGGFGSGSEGEDVQGTPPEPAAAADNTILFIALAVLAAGVVIAISIRR